MIYRIENIQLVFENNTRINVKPYRPIVVHDLEAFRKMYTERSANIPRKSPLKYVYFTYEEYNDR